jgi:hypothetical protein
VAFLDEQTVEGKFRVRRRRKADFDFLEAAFHERWNNSSFCETFIGTASAWLPSRKSTLHQRGACVRTRLGHWRSGNATGGNGRYFLDGSFVHGVWLSDYCRPAVKLKQKTHRRLAVG